ncbi:MAG: transglycosylase SLT domain-containing protein [Rhodobacteraceae bacterium]|jgi:hypothetical protein|nr:transglycosylase SLT domain-containing protein [Paracoccaceae bacterium]
MKLPSLRAAALLALILPAACNSMEARNAAPEVPVARWDFRPEGRQWTEASVAALASYGQPLVNIVPRDIEAWCPGYETATEDERKAFWVGLLSSLAKHESTWRPEAAGGGGRWFGLLQISPATARHYGCEARTGEALKDGAANLACAIRIMAVTVPRDGVVAANGGGIAADWGPFHQATKREEMRTWVRSQPYCAPSGRSATRT